MIGTSCICDICGKTAAPKADGEILLPAGWRICTAPHLPGQQATCCSPQCCAAFSRRPAEARP